MLTPGVKKPSNATGCPSTGHEGVKGNKFIAPLIFNLGSKFGGVVGLTRRPLYLRYPLNRKLGGQVLKEIFITIPAEYCQTT